MYPTNPDNRFLPGVPAAEVEAFFNAAAGDEIGRGKFDNAESSARLAANAFGFFLGRAAQLPPLPNCEFIDWRVEGITLEQTVRFPWAGGRHPVLDAYIQTDNICIGVESKRFEPFRDAKKFEFRPAYLRPVWGEHMRGYEKMRDALRGGKQFQYLDAAQLIKHAFALRTAAQKDPRGRTPVLFYVYAEPKIFPNSKKNITAAQHTAHRAEIAEFAAAVAGDEVRFAECSYQEMLTAWAKSADAEIRAHAERIQKCFAP